MKARILFPVAVLLCLALPAGCKLIDSNHMNADEFSKAQRITVAGADGTEKAVLTEEADIDAFVEAMDLESWRIAELPEGLAGAGSFTLWQTETVTAFTGGKEAAFNELFTFRFYRDRPYLTIDTGFAGIAFTFSVPQAAADYLRDLAERRQTSAVSP